MTKKLFPKKTSRLQSHSKTGRKYTTAKTQDVNDSPHVYVFIEVSFDESVGMYKATTGEYTGYSESKERAIGFALEHLGQGLLKKHKRFPEK